MTAATPAGAATRVPPACPGNTNVFNPGTLLESGYQLDTGDEKLYMQPDGNLVIYLSGYYGSPPALWSSGTSGNPGAYALMQIDGNFVIYRQGGGPDLGGALWSTRTWGRPDACGKFALDGEFEVITASPPPTTLWTSGTGVPFLAADGTVPDRLSPGDRLRPGQWIASQTVWLVMQPDGNLVLYRQRGAGAVWSSRTWGNPGAYAVLQNDGNLVVYRAGRNDPAGALWSSRTWGNPNDKLVAQFDGNLVLYRAGRSDPAGALWSTGTWFRG